MLDTLTEQQLCLLVAQLALAWLLLPITGNPGSGNAIPAMAVSLCGGGCRGFNRENVQLGWSTAPDHTEAVGGRPGPKSDRDEQRAQRGTAAPWRLRPRSQALGSTSGASPPGTT